MNYRLNRIIVKSIVFGFVSAVARAPDEDSFNSVSGRLPRRQRGAVELYGCGRPGSSVDKHNTRRICVGGHFCGKVSVFWELVRLNGAFVLLVWLIRHVFCSVLFHHPVLNAATFMTTLMAI